MSSRFFLTLSVLVCVASLLVQQTVARPYEENDRQRQAAIILAERIVRNMIANEEMDYQPSQVKRNSGMLDAVIQMPDLLKHGRK